MNKKLSELFAEAKPEELDVFCDALQATEVPAQLLASLKEKTYTRTGLTRKTNRKAIWWRVAAIAACLCVVICAVAMMKPGKDDPGLFVPGDGTDSSATKPPENTEPPVTPPDVAEPDPGYSGPSDIITVSDPKVFQDKLKGNSLEFVTGSSVRVDESGYAEPPSFEFGYSGLVVKAKVVENYEDTYYKLDISADVAPRAYRLIQLEILEEIHGTNMPQYVLYLVPEGYFLDLSVYDSLLISMRQIGTENYVLRNGTKNQIEAFIDRIWET